MDKINPSTITIIKRIIYLFPTLKLKKLIFLSIAQLFVNLLDVVGVAIIGAIGILSIAGIQSQENSMTIDKLLTFLNLEKFDFRNQVVILGISAILVLTLKTILNLILNYKIINQLSKITSKISSNHFETLINSNYEKLKKVEVQNHIYYLTSGIGQTINGVMGGALNLIVDFALFIFLVSGLILVDAGTAVTTIIFFGIITLLINLAIKEKIIKIGGLDSEKAIQINQEIKNSLSNYRELVVRNLQITTSMKMAKNFDDKAKLILQTQITPTLNKYVLEITTLFYVFFLSGFAFIMYDAKKAIALLALYLATTSRIVPAIMRLQQSLYSIKVNLTPAHNTLNYLANFSDQQPINRNKLTYQSDNKFQPNLKVEDLSFKYADSSNYVFENLNFEIHPGEKIALIGKSGAGKSTLVDLFFGILKPTIGKVTLSELSPSECINKFPGKVAYIPQNPTFINGSIRDYLISDLDLELTDEDLIKILTNTMLLFNEKNSLSLDYVIGENGNNLSGGQRQRLAIAKALITSPEFVVFDEATNAIDYETEKTIVEGLFKTETNFTLIMITHNRELSKYASKVIEIDNGKFIV